MSLYGSHPRRLVFSNAMGLLRSDYHTEDNNTKTAEDTLVDVQKYSESVGIPYSYVLLDSWWYYKGNNSGVTVWDVRPTTAFFSGPSYDPLPSPSVLWRMCSDIGGVCRSGQARPDVFPDGLAGFFRKTHWPTMLHNRMWATDSNYSKANGGQYIFINDGSDVRAASAPIPPSFYVFARLWSAQNCFMWIFRCLSRTINSSGTT